MINRSNEIISIVSKEDISCPISGEVFFDPSITYPCGHLFENEMIHKWMEKNTSCPCCRSEIIKINNPPPFFNHFFQQVLANNLFLHDERYFDLTSFLNCLSNNLPEKLNKMILMLQNSAKHLNMPCDDQMHRGLNPIYFLTKFGKGRKLLTDHLLLREKISAEGINIIGQTAGEEGFSAVYWLTMYPSGQTLLLNDARLRSLISRETLMKQVSAPGEHHKKSPAFWLMRTDIGKEILKIDAELSQKIGYKKNTRTFSFLNRNQVESQENKKNTKVGNGLPVAKRNRR